MEALHVYPKKNQQKAVEAFLEALNVPYEKEEILPDHVIQGIHKGLDDIKAGRTITLEEFERRRAESK